MKTSSPASKISTEPVLSPVQRMAASRQQLLKHMARGNDPEFESDPENHPEGESGPLKSTMVSKLIHTIRVWWRHHPAKLALEIAEPALHQYAKGKPFQLLGIATAAGAAVVFVRPWRLVSITGLLLAAIKSSGMTNMAISLVSARLRSQGSSRQTSFR